MDATMEQDVRRRMEYERERAAPPPGFPRFPDIPLARYTDPALFQAEIDCVFRKTWQFAGHQSEWPEAGSYRLLDLPFAPVLVCRGKDGVLRAFLNSCRHRGAPVVREPAGKAKTLSCQFHAWTYDLMGKLVSVPWDRDFVDLDREERSLVPVRCESWAGFVYVNLDAEAQPLLDYFAPAVRWYSDVMDNPYRLVTSRSYDINCNWKLFIEAFVESYHVDIVHPQTASPFKESYSQVIVLHPNGHSAMFAPDRPATALSAEVRDLFFPPDLPRLPDCRPIYYDNSTMSVTTFPNVMYNFDVLGFPIFVYTPLAVNKSRMTIHFYGLDWGDGPPPAGWEARVQQWDVLTSEDMKNLEPIQRSIEAAAHRGVPLSYQERRIWHLHTEIDRWLGERMPPALRVPDLLGDYLEP